MSYKILHFSDLHIHRLKYHEEYRKIFNEFYRLSREENPDYIVFTGDLFHTKLELTPEAIQLASEFLKNLSEIAPLHLILGNHDLNLNGARLDSITPVVNAINSDRIHFHKFSGEKFVDEKLVFNVMSVVDSDKWVYQPSNSEKINIALYHGSINGVITDTGYTMTECDNDIEIFKNMDYGFLGDIHVSNQILDDNGRLRYAGAAAQTNFSEADDKGFLVWTIHDKTNYECKHVVVNNPKPFISVYLDENGEIKEEGIKNGARLRLVVESNIGVDRIKKNLDILKSKFKPESVAYINKSTASETIEKDIQTHSEAENLRNIEVQDKLIRTYLQDYKLDESTVEEVVKLNRKFNTDLAEEEVGRNIKWKLKSLEWDNLFNYGESNKINYSNLTGLIGLQGPNASGKTSAACDALLYALFNTTSKGNRKNLNVINQNKDTCSAKAIIEIDGNDFIVERKSEKYVKKLHNQETLEAKTVVEFKTDSELLNGLDRNDTDKLIRKYIGSVDDFLTTSMASQFGFLSFISEGSTKRKEILAKFLDLEMFEKKFKLAKEEAAELKAVLKKLEGKNYDEDILNTKIEITQTEKSIHEKEEKERIIEQDISNKNILVDEIKKKLQDIPKDFDDFEKTKESLENSKKLLEKATKEHKTLSEKIENSQVLLKKIDEFLANIDINSLQEKQKELSERKRELQLLEKDIDKILSKINGDKKKLQLLNEVPCGPEFKHCKFIKDAYAAKDSLVLHTNEKQSLENSSAELNNRVEELEKENIDTLIGQFEQISQKRKKVNSEMFAAISDKSIRDFQIQASQKDIEELQKKIEYFEKHKEIIDNIEKYTTERNVLTKQIEQEQKNLKTVKTEILNAHKKHAASLQKLELLENDKKELENTRKQYAAYDLYLQCMHPSGISYDIIKKKLPIVNSEIAKVLGNVVDFNAYLVNDDNKLDLMIKYPNYEARPLEMGSGAEKTISSMAIRLALTKITTLPLSSILILDEPGTSLDGEKLDGFIKMLDLIKQHFDTVVVISHLETFKDNMDLNIIIENRKGYAYINQ